MSELPGEVRAVMEVLLPAVEEVLGDRILSIVLWGSAVPEWRDRIEVAYVGVPSLRNFRAREHVIARISPG